MAKKGTLFGENGTKCFTTPNSNSFLSVLHVNKAFYNFYKGNVRLLNAVFAYIRDWYNNLDGNSPSLCTDRNVFLPSVLSNIFILSFLSLLSFYLPFFFPFYLFLLVFFLNIANRMKPIKGFNVPK